MVNSSKPGTLYLTVEEFPRISPLTTKYECPQLSLLIITSVPETNKIEPKSYSIIPCLCIQAPACFEHSNFFKVNVANPAHTQLRARTVFAKKKGTASDIPCGWPIAPSRNPSTSFLTATTLVYAIGAGVTATAGTRLSLQSFLVKRFKLYSFQLRIQDLKSPVLLFFLTTSLRQDCVIFAPAAFLGCGSRFSGSLSGIEPWFSVTRCNHGKPLPYHRQLIGQKFECIIAGENWQKFNFRKMLIICWTQ